MPRDLEITNKYILAVYFEEGECTVYIALAENKNVAIQAAKEHFADCAVKQIECYTEEEVYDAFNKRTN